MDGICKLNTVTIAMASTSGSASILSTLPPELLKMIAFEVHPTVRLSCKIFAAHTPGTLQGVTANHKAMLIETGELIKARSVVDDDKTKKMWAVAGDAIVRHSCASKV